MPPFMPLSLNLQGLLLVAVGDVDNLEGYREKGYVSIGSENLQFVSCFPGAVAFFNRN